MDGLKNHGSKPELKMDDLGGKNPLFSETSIWGVTWCPAVRFWECLKGKQVESLSRMEFSQFAPKKFFGRVRDTCNLEKNYTWGFLKTFFFSLNPRYAFLQFVEKNSLRAKLPFRAKLLDKRRSGQNGFRRSFWPRAEFPVLGRIFSLN